MEFFNIHLSYRSLNSAATLFAAILLLLFSVLWTPCLIKAAAMEPSDIVQKLQVTYEQAKTLSADFKQTTAMQLSSRVKEGSGSMVFSKPGHMRWDYSAPDQQVLVSDGETFSMYFAQSKQMIVTAAKEFLQSDVTYSFFSGTGDITKDFDIKEPDLPNKNAENSYLIKLSPRKAHSQVAYMHAWITKHTFLINRLQIVDHFDTVTDLFFSNIHIDFSTYNGQDIDDDLFFFTPPPGTEIIEQ